MSETDFEIASSFRARELAVHVPPDVVTETEGEDVELCRREARNRSPAELRAGETYDDVVVEKRVIGRLDA